MAEVENSPGEASERTPLLLRARRSSEDSDDAPDRGEIGRVIRIAAPLVVFCAMRYWIIGITIWSTGRLGVTELAAASLGLLHTNVVGFSIILGTNSGLDTLANQAAGSASPSLASLYTLRQLVLQMAMMPVMFVLMWYGTTAVHFISPNADPEMLALAKFYLRVMFWALPAYSASDCLRRFCGSIGNVNGPTIANMIGMPVSVGLNYLLVCGPSRFRLGFIGAPIGVVVAYHCVFFATLIYALVTTPKRAWCGLSRAIVQDLGPNVRLGLQGSIALCSEWWAFEALGIGSTFLGPATQATTAIFSTLISMSFPGPYAVSLATAIRVGNLIGAKKAEGARKAAKAGQNIALSIVLCSSGSLVLFHNRIGACITGDARILQMIAQYYPILAVMVVADGLQVANSGVLRGAGLPGIAAQVNVTAYWGLGVWLSLGMALKFRNFPSLWSGFVVAVVCAQLAVRYRIHRINWQVQVESAAARMDKNNNLDENASCQDELSPQ